MKSQYTITKENVTANRALLRLQKIQLYISQNLSANLHAANVASQFNMSISSLLHLFSKHPQGSYHRYIESVRIEKAIELLQTKNITVKEVMYATGYKNRTTFSNAFKKKFKHAAGHFKN